MAERDYDLVVISPHLDDAALSCGGAIAAFAAGGSRILVLTLATAEPDPERLSPLARELHRRWGLGREAVAERRREDEAACRLLGAEARHAGFDDALYRRHPATGEPLYPTLASLHAPPHPADRELVAALALRLAGLEPARRVLAPLGAGRHVDHLLAREACEEVFGDRLELYEDYPYARQRWVLRKALGWPWRWRARVEPLDEAALATKIEAVARYRSQLESAFRDRDDLERQLRRAARRAGGERFWRRR